jgi:hypothetical protein
MAHGFTGIEAGASAQLCSQAGAWEQEEIFVVLKKPASWREIGTLSRIKVKSKM